MNNNYAIGAYVIVIIALCGYLATKHERLAIAILFVAIGVPLLLN